MDIDDNDSRVQYTKDTDWECKQEQHDHEMGTTVHIAHIDKASLSLEFNGTGVDVIGFVNNTNSQELLTCTMEDGQRVGPQVTPNDGAQPVTFCSITSLRNGQHTLRVNIGSNGVDNISIDKFHISTNSPPPTTTSASAPQTSTSIAPPAASLSAPAVPTQTDRGPEAGQVSPTGPPSQTSSGSVSITSSRPTAITGSGSSGSESVTVTSPSPSTSSSPNNIPSQTSSAFTLTFSSGQSQSSVSSTKSESSTSSSTSLETPLASATTSAMFTHTHQRTNPGAIIGGLLGGILTLILLLAALACFRRRLRAMNRQKQESGPRVWQPSPDSARDEMSTINNPEPPLKTWTPEAFYTPSSYPDTAPAPVTLDEAFTRPFSLSSSSYTVLPDGLPASHHSSTRLLMSSTSFLSETSRSSVASDKDSESDVQSRASSVEDLSGMRPPIPVRQSWYAV